MLGLAQKIFGSANDRAIKSYRARAEEITALEPQMQKLSDADLQNKTKEFKERLENGETTDNILPEAFAVCREAAKRVLNMRHFDVQLIGGMVLHEGNIAEMKTGEGKTLVATLPTYLNALEGKGVHVITVNDYLAQRDAQWMGKLYNFLGLSVGVIVNGITEEQRKKAYRCDITYGTNNEFGFDYLRDNMKFSLQRMAQRELHYAIVDEVDSILIDEARTPLIISGPSDPSTDKYLKVNAIIPGLQKDQHYKVDEKSRSATLTEEGVSEAERRLEVDNLYDPTNIEILHHVIQALKAHVVFKRDVDYVVKEGQVQIVDEFTGRILPGRRWSDGLHQAVEAKEGVPVESENQTLASITFQNYFRMYKKLSGMTGTADTEAPEFQNIYKLSVVVIPTNRPSQRQDDNDVIYKSETAKFKAVVEQVKEEHEQGRPVLIGTIAIEKSEVLSKMLTRAGVRHNVLNAKQHGKEADIVAQAGRPGAVTVSTNMAGRGTDIVLGGNPEFLAKSKADPDENPEEYQKALEEFKKLCVEDQKKLLDLGGLLVLGTERHESRRIDNQLRGRTGRQGDPGATRFYVSLDDDLMRIFGSERISNVMNRLGMGEDEVIEHKWITKALENAQKKVEAHNFEIRKNVLEYDDVMNQQRTTIYSRRKKILAGQHLEEELTDMLDSVVSMMADQLAQPKKSPIDLEIFDEHFFDQFGFHLELAETEWDSESLGQKIYDSAFEYYQNKKEQYGPLLDQAVRFFMLQTLDDLWKDHLLTMDHLREGIGLRGYGQKDPKQEYKKEGFALFENMIFRSYQQSLEKIFKVQIQTEEEVKLKEKPQQDIQLSRGEAPKKNAPAPIKRSTPKVGRNDDCPCGSGKKYKKCHGQKEEV
ncbi:MAG: preprotein translocase subunit SecA [Deltaproteobacteria bacterium]|nr:preprotein translocase subunit SecA [Deltaproteobacteria bacterium]